MYHKLQPDKLVIAIQIKPEAKRQDKNTLHNNTNRLAIANQFCTISQICNIATKRNITKPRKLIRSTWNYSNTNSSRIKFLGEDFAHYQILKNRVSRQDAVRLISKLGEDSVRINTMYISAFLVWSHLPSVQLAIIYVIGALAYLYANRVLFC